MVTIETYGQTFTTTVAGVTHNNDDGTSRQEVIRRCCPGQPLRLIRESGNPYDRYAVAVETMTGARLGYVPAGDVRLARHIDQGGEVEARFLKCTGGSGLLGLLFPSLRKNYGCVIRITKGSFDWNAMEPWMKADRKAQALTREAQKQEKADPERAVSLYREAIEAICTLDAQGEQATAWRHTEYPINGLSLTLDRMGQHEEALREIEHYEAYNDRNGLSRSDSKALEKRKARLLKRTKSGP